MHREDLVILALGVVVLGGCATSGESERFLQFSQSTREARQRTEGVFQAMLEVDHQVLAERAATQLQLSPDQFKPLLDETLSGRWARALEGLESYADTLAILSSPKKTEAARENVLAVGRDLKRLGIALEQQDFYPGDPMASAVLAAGFLRLGEKILAEQGAQTARRLVQQADPVIQSMLGSMAEMIGQNRESNLRATVQAQWQQLMARRQADFLGAQDPAHKRKLAAEYGELLRGRNKLDELAGAWRRSLLSLARLHQGLLEPRSPSFNEAVQQWRHEIREALRLQEEVRQLLQP